MSRSCFLSNQRMFDKNSLDDIADLPLQVIKEVSADFLNNRSTNHKELCRHILCSLDFGESVLSYSAAAISLQPLRWISQVKGQVKLDDYYDSLVVKLTVAQNTRNYRMSPVDSRRISLVSCFSCGVTSMMRYLTTHTGFLVLDVSTNFMSSWARRFEINYKEFIRESARGIILECPSWQEESLGLLNIEKDIFILIVRDPVDIIINHYLNLQTHSIAYLYSNKVDDASDVLMAKKKKYSTLSVDDHALCRPQGIFANDKHYLVSLNEIYCNGDFMQPFRSLVMLKKQVDPARLYIVKYSDLCCNRKKVSRVIQDACEDYVANGLAFPKVVEYENRMPPSSNLLVESAYKPELLGMASGSPQGSLLMPETLSILRQRYAEFYEVFDEYLD